MFFIRSPFPAIDNEVQLLDQLELEPPETVLVFEVLRDGKRLKITLRPAAPPTQTGEGSST